MKRLAIALACAALAAGAAGQANATSGNWEAAKARLGLMPANTGAVCLSTSKTMPGMIKPAAGARILVLTPDVSVGIMTMAGQVEPRADWIQQGRDNIVSEVQASLKTAGHPFQILSASDAMEGHNGQVLRLHEAVGASIITFTYTPYKLPTKKAGLDWTLGEGAKGLGETYGADYALFTVATGSWSSGGRKMAWLAAAAVLGASIPLGGQTAVASLVDLRTGQVVWFNMTIAAPTADMRTPAGAHMLVTALLKDMPL